MILLLQTYHLFNMNIINSVIPMNIKQLLICFLLFVIIVTTEIYDKLHNVEVRKTLINDLQIIKINEYENIKNYI